MAMNELGRGSLSKMAVRLGRRCSTPFAWTSRGAGQPAAGQALRLGISAPSAPCGRKTRRVSPRATATLLYQAGAVRQLHRQPGEVSLRRRHLPRARWGERFCMTDHGVPGQLLRVKVGITRASQIPTRWLDQGASQALPIFPRRHPPAVGLVEDLLRTGWRTRPTGARCSRAMPKPLDLPAIRDQLLESCAEGIAALQQRFGLQAIQSVGDATCWKSRYPVEAYPTKVASHDLGEDAGGGGHPPGHQGPST